MSPDNLNLQIAAEVERGEAALRAAEQLLASGLFYDAASRAYYAAFHHVRALCLLTGQEPRSHQGVGHMLNMSYVRAGTLPADTSRLYATLQQFRESSDYDATFVFILKKRVP